MQIKWWLCNAPYITPSSTLNWFNRGGTVEVTLLGTRTDGFYLQRDGYCLSTHLHQIWVPGASGPLLPALTKHRKAGVCLIIRSKISELKVEARGRVGWGHPGGREVVRHDLLKSGVAKPQGHPLVLRPIGAGRPTINLLCTLNPFNTHHDPDEEISSLREGHITLLALCIHWQLLYSNSVLWVTSYCKYFDTDPRGQSITVIFKQFHRVKEYSVF